MDLNQPFEQILDSDEEIQKVYKPNKFKMFSALFMYVLFCWIWIAIFTAGIILSDLQDPYTWWISLIVIAALLVFMLLVTWLIFALEYKNTFYAYTNKRIVIRRGVFGVDFKSLDMNMVGAITVNVSLLDKILRRGTGTIIFGSMASPMSNNGMFFRFAHVTEVYDKYKEIKSVIDEQKLRNKNPINS